ncbi:uncharacterized protein LOC114290545 [Camellia sinensis]|uniref:uncharacterized protein LOC114290545 n=1 Tax=Camellia sinensis TaxID=4442 RepID=UPI001036B10E|nr:uncharacterized protein LOC114290545 [Camellia sinensis]
MDDILVTGSDSSVIQSLLHYMHVASSMKELGDISYFLGIPVLSISQGYFLSQPKYATDLLHKAGMLECKPCSTPMAIKPSSSTSDDLPYSQPQLYRSLVGALQYLTITRPDISLAVNHACQHMHVPTIAHFALVKRILRYVKGTLTHGLRFTPGPFTLHAFTDANWAGDSLDRRSTSGFCVFLGPNLISWSAKKQPTVSRSSTEAEYRSMASTTAELVWLQQLLKDLCISSSSPPVLWCDNISAMALASNPVFHSRLKHIEVDCHFIRDRVGSKQISLAYISTSDQIANIFTKLLTSARFHYLKDKLLVLPRPICLQRNDKSVSSRAHLNTQIAEQHSSPSSQLQQQIKLPHNNDNRTRGIG